MALVTIVGTKGSTGLRDAIDLDLHACRVGLMLAASRSSAIEFKSLCAAVSATKDASELVVDVGELEEG